MVLHGSTAVQNQKVVSVYFTSKQILHFDFAEQNCSAITILSQKFCFLIKYKNIHKQAK